MIETEMRFKTVEDVSQFVKLAAMCVDNVVVYSSTSSVDGKSIMGMFSLDLTNPIKVEFHGDIPQEVKEGMKNFIVN